MRNWFVVLNDIPSQREVGKPRANGARPRLTLEILWTNSNVLRILGGPGRNRTTDTRIFNSVPQTKLPLDLKRFTPPEANFVHTTFLGVCMRLIWLSYFDPHKDYKWIWWCHGDLTDTRMWCPCCGRGTPRMKRPFKGRFGKRRFYRRLDCCFSNN